MTPSISSISSSLGSLKNITIDDIVAITGENNFSKIYLIKICYDINNAAVILTPANRRLLPPLLL